MVDLHKNEDTYIKYDGIIDDLIHELVEAHEEYPDPNANFRALVSEVGELSESLIEHDRYDSDTYGEAIDVAVTALRIAREQLVKLKQEQTEDDS